MVPASAPSAALGFRAMLFLEDNRRGFLPGYVSLAARRDAGVWPARLNFTGIEPQTVAVFATAAATAVTAWSFTPFRRLARKRLRRAGRGGACILLAAKPRPDPESLRWALELAVRAEDYEEAARIQAVLPESDASSPVTAMRGVVRERVRTAVDEAFDVFASPEMRHAAVLRLQELATAPAAFPEAEDGLHRVLAEVAVGDRMAAVAEKALWDVWFLSGSEEADRAMEHGGIMMERGNFREAVEIFTDVVVALPDYAEAWNKRATALFLAQRYEESIADCHRVLELKPRHFGCLSGLGLCYLRQDNEQAAVRWLRESLEVNPHNYELGRMVGDLEVRSVISFLRPRMHEVMTRMSEPLLDTNAGAASVFGGGEFGRISRPRAGIRDRHVDADWVAHRVEDLEPHTYLFLVHVRSRSEPVVSGAARFYALKTTNGSHVIPLQRLTLDPLGFKLRSGESYRYSFMVTLDKELSLAEGGLILRCHDDIFEAPLQCLDMDTAPRISKDDLEAVNDGFLFMGRLQIPIED